MKKILLSLFALAVLMPAAARADTVIINPSSDNNTQVRKLPGNAQIVTGGSNPTVEIRDDSSVLYRTLVSPYGYTRNNYNNNYGNGVNAPNTASFNDVQSICGNERNMSQQNKCIRDVIKEKEKLQRRYND